MDRVIVFFTYLGFEEPNQACNDPTLLIDNFDKSVHKQIHLHKIYHKDNFHIHDIFIINGKESYEFDLDTFSLQITNITNKKGNIFNGNEELVKDSFFNAKNKFLIHKRQNDDGYLMVITIATKPRNRESIQISTCEKEAKLYLYVSQKNCTMNSNSNNFC
jgi:hypothetical protein